jgi:hypothetical protein
MNRRWLPLIAPLGAAAAAGAVVSSCAPTGFESETVIDTVRIVASRADNDEAFARPGEAVTVEALTLDGRPVKTPPAVTYWLPYLCVNPADDAYYGCFASLLAGDGGSASGAPAPAPADAGAGAGADGGGGTEGGATPVLSGSALATFLEPGTDLTPLLPTGPFTFTVPAGTVISRAGSAPYGLVILFNIACTGRVKVTAIDPAAGPQQVPIGCFDDAGAALGPDQYVIGFTRVYVYDARTDLNPRINGILFNGVETQAADAGNANPPPVSVTVPACHGSCSGIPLDMDVPVSSWTGQSKSIWVDYYASPGGLSDEARLLYDENAGALSDAKNRVTFTPPDDPGTATLWAVVHDTNGGVTWLQVNVTAR